MLLSACFLLAPWGRLTLLLLRKQLYLCCATVMRVAANAKAQAMQ
jgi:hypothetical protein